jgi:hypothetical protein
MMISLTSRRPVAGGGGRRAAAMIGTQKWNKRKIKNEHTQERN